MVTTVDTAPIADTPSAVQPSIVELVGPAGAGKSTLLSTLSQHSRRIKVGAFPQVRTIGHLPYFIKNGALLLPMFVQLIQKSSRLPSREELVRMCYLRDGPRFLVQQASDQAAIIVLDQGPIFMLATLHEFGPDGFRHPAAIKWWERMYELWASVLDVVVWLDAPDTVLVQRIAGRDKWHSVKDKSDQEAFALLEQYRTAYRHVISRLTAGVEGPRLLCFNTAQSPLEQTSSRILGALEREARFTQ